MQGSSIALLPKSIMVLRFPIRFQFEIKIIVLVGHKTPFQWSTLKVKVLKDNLFDCHVFHNYLYNTLRLQALYLSCEEDSKHFENTFKMATHTFILIFHCLLFVAASKHSEVDLEKLNEKIGKRNNIFFIY